MSHRDAVGQKHPTRNDTHSTRPIMLARLIGSDGSRFYSWPLTPGNYVVGRAPECTLCVPDKTVSRRHAQLEVSADGKTFEVEDLGSHNGTTVNGQKVIARVTVQPGDKIAFGAAEFRVTIEGAPSTAGSGTQTRLAEKEPERSVFLDLNEALRPLPARVADTADLLPTLFEMAGSLVLPEPSEVILQRSLSLVARVIPAERLAVLFLSPDQKEVYTAATLLPTGKDPGTFRLSRTILHELLDKRSAVLVGNPADDPRFASQQSIVISDLRAAMAVPLFDESRVLGVLYVDTSNPIHHYTDEYLRLLATFGNIIASRLVNAALLRDREEKQALDVEVRRASLIQRKLLPATMPTVPGYSVMPYQRQSRSVGGDLYDLVQLPDGRLVIAVADVSGKGLGAALLMSTILSSLRTLYQNSAFELEQAVRFVSHQLCRYSNPEDFATMLLATVDPHTHELVYVNAGHNPPLLVHADGNLDKLEICGLMIGAFDFATWTVQRTSLSPGDMVVIFSDGVTEAMHGEEPYSDERLERRVQSWRAYPPSEVVDRLMKDIEQFVGDTPQSDDITLLLLKRDN